MKKILLALLILSHFTASAQRTPPPSVGAGREGVDYAVFFVASKFDNGWTTLEHAPGEVKAIGDLLRDQYGFDVRIVTDATRAKIVQTLAEYKRKPYGPQDQLLLFFSMHGVHDADSDQGYLVPKDGLYDDPSYESWYSHAALRDLAHSMKCPRVLVALDACYSGIFGKGRDKPGTPPWENTPDCQSKVRAAFASSPTRKYLTAGGDTRVPAKSIFAAQWQVALKTGAGSDDLLSYTELMAKLDEFRDPRPTWGNFVPGTDGDFVFVRKNPCAAQPAPSNSGAANQDKEFWRQTEALNTLVGYRKYLRDCGLCLYTEEAEAAITRLKPVASVERETDSPTVGSKAGDLMPDGMVFVKGGKFLMGSPSTEADRGDDEQQHEVELSDFYIGKYEVTQKQWRDMMGSDPPELYFKNCDNCPVERVSWDDIQEFIKKLNQQTGKNYRLPTEAEWEYAAKGGNKSSKFAYAGVADKSNLDKYANFCDQNCEYSWKTESSNDGYKGTAPVGKLLPNELGLHDMSGNVWEWCGDWYGSDYYKSSAAKNPTGPGSGSYRVIRGGSWYGDPQDCRAANRFDYAPGNRGNSVGFRLARTN